DSSGISTTASPRAAWACTSGNTPDCGKGGPPGGPDSTMRGPEGSNESNPRPNARRLSTALSIAFSVFAATVVVITPPNPRRPASRLLLQHRCQSHCHCHPERSSWYAKRTSYGVEGPACRSPPTPLQGSPTKLMWGQPAPAVLASSSRQPANSLSRRHPERTKVREGSCAHDVNSQSQHIDVHRSNILMVVNLFRSLIHRFHRGAFTTRFSSAKGAPVSSCSGISTGILCPMISRASCM